MADDFEPGSSRRLAIDVTNVLDEYAWLKEHFPNYDLIQQSLCLDIDGAYDLLEIRTADGDIREIYFRFRRPKRKR